MRNRRGFSIPELLVSMTIFSMMTTIIVVLYHSVTVAYRHNFVRLDNSDRAREAFRRIVPLVSSACPSGPGSAILEPAVPAATAVNAIVLSGTRQFINNYVYGTPGAVSPYVPFRISNTEFGTYRIWFQERSGVPANRNPAGKVGDIYIDANTPSAAADDRILARNIYDCSFQNAGSNRILVTVNVYGLDRTAINQATLQRLTYRSEVWLPFYSNTIGN